MSALDQFGPVGFLDSLFSGISRTLQMASDSNFQGCLSLILDERRKLDRIGGRDLVGKDKDQHRQHQLPLIIAQ